MLHVILLYNFNVQHVSTLVQIAIIRWI